jgi:hypothetical protein
VDQKTSGLQLTQTFALRLASAYAKAARFELVIRELWVTTEQAVVHLWLVTNVTTQKMDQDLRSLASKMPDEFSKAAFEIHIVKVGLSSSISYV